MGQIMNDMVRKGGTYMLKMQNKYHDQITNGKRIKGIQPGDAEQVQ